MKVTKRDIFILIIVSLILVAIGTTFAYFSFRSTNNPVVDITVEDMADVTFQGGNDINVTNIGPVLDYNDGEITEFTVKKKIEDVIYIQIDITPTVLPDYLKHESFKCMLLSSTDGVNYTIETELNFVDKVVDQKYQISTIELTDNNIKYYKVIFYIDGHVQNPITMQNQNFGATIDVLVYSNSCSQVVYNDDNSITYADKKWYKISEDDGSVTLVLAENYGTGSYGSYSTINDSYWATSTIKTKLDEFLTNSSINTECLVEDATYGYVRAPYQNELSTNIPNDSGTPFWTMNSIDSSYVVVGKADGTLYEGYNEVSDAFVQVSALWGSAYSGGPHGLADGSQSYLWDRYAVTAREWGALKFYPYGSAYNYDQQSTVYVASGGGVEQTIEDVVDCFDSTKNYWSYSWYTSSYSKSTDRTTASVCTDNGVKTVYLCHEVACCRYGSMNSSVNGGSYTYRYKDFTYKTYSSCNSRTEYTYTSVNETIGYRPVITVLK